MSAQHRQGAAADRDHRGGAAGGATGVGDEGPEAYRVGGVDLAGQPAAALVPREHRGRSRAKPDANAPGLTDIECGKTY